MMKKSDGNKRKNLSLKQVFSTRSSKAGSYSAVITAIAVAIVIVVNLIVSAIPTTYTKRDLTSSNIYTLSQQSLEIAASLEDEVTIYHIVQSGNENSYITELLNRYKQSSNKIKVVTKDPVVYPNFASQYTDEQVSDNSLIVVCGDNYKYIPNSDLFVYDEEQYYYYQMGYSDGVDVSFDGENCITGAIDLLTSGITPTIYNITGHGDTEVDSSFISALENNNFKVESLNLLSSTGIPEEADCLMLVGAKSDLSAAEKKTLVTYIKSGGKLFITTDYGTDAMPNIEQLLRYYGVETVDGLVFEGDTSKCMMYYSYILPDMAEHEITSALNGYNVLMPNAQGITQLDGKRDTLDIEPLLSTSSSAVSKLSGFDTQSLDKESGDIDGPFDLAVAITDTTDEGTQSKIVYYSTSGFINSTADNYYVSGRNSDLFVNSLGWLCGKTSSISIHAKSIDNSTLTVTSGAANYISILLIGIIPAAILITGVIIWFGRKRK